VEHTHNGGFPEPLTGEPVRQVRCTHEECGADTLVRIPFDLEAEGVRRVVCEGCGRVYERDAVLDETAPAAAPPSRVPGWLSDPDSRAWRYLSIPIAAAAVIAALALIQGC
jgi:hypothetical protein